MRDRIRGVLLGRWSIPVVVVVMQKIVKVC
jgi:hypothetical protein